LYFLLKWDGLQTPEMQSRLRALPFLTGLTRGRSLPPPEHASQPLIRPDQIVESISQRFLSLLITPSQPARPIDRRLIGEWIGVEMVQSCRNESFVCFLKQWLGGRRSAPYFQPLQLVLTSFAIRTDTKKNAGDSSEMQKRIRLIPDPKSVGGSLHVPDSTTNMLNEGGWIAYSQPLVIRKSLDFAYAQSSEAGGDSIRSNVNRIR
jgi:hypothetical protein